MYSAVSPSSVARTGCKRPTVAQCSHACHVHTRIQTSRAGAFLPALPSPLGATPLQPVAPRRQAGWRVHAQEAVGGSIHFEGAVVAQPHQQYAVVVARFNELVTARLLEGAMAAFRRHGVDPMNVKVAWVPGSFELPLVCKSMAKSGQFAAVVGIGAVIRGATTHYDAVVSGATSGLLGASTSTGVPVVFGVLTCDTMEQALDRAGGKVGNKGGEAAITAIEMANLMAELQETGFAAAAWTD